MTVLAQNEKLTATFQAVCDHLTHADPNDFDSQIPPTFVSCDAEQNTVVCSFEVKKSFGNPHGNMHGGLIAAMIDSAQGMNLRKKEYGNWNEFQVLPPNRQKKNY